MPPLCSKSYFTIWVAYLVYNVALNSAIDKSLFFCYTYLFVKISTQDDAMKKVVVVELEKSERGGFIAKNVTDNAAWVVPGNRERHQAPVKLGDWSLVEITGTAKSGRLRFCKILLNVDEILHESMQGSNISIKNFKIVGMDVCLIKDLTGGFRLNIPLYSCIEGVERGKTIVTLEHPKMIWEWEKWTREEKLVIEGQLKKLLYQFLEERKKERERIEKEQCQKRKELISRALTDPEDELGKIVREMAQDALKKGRSYTMNEKQEKLLDGITQHEIVLRSIAEALKIGNFKVGIANHRYYIATVEGPESKKAFLEDHPEADFKEDDPNFWKKACELAGEFLYEYRTKCYCLVIRHRMYRVMAGGIPLRKSFEVGSGIDHDQDDGPRYM